MVTSQQERIETLERRLQDGFIRIGEAMNNGLNVSDWEKFWIELLREYETLNDELASTPLEQAEMPGLPRREAA
jgi:hypothetical protein